MKITQNLYMLSGCFFCGGDYDQFGNIYGIHTPEGMILIDSGLPGHGAEMVADTMKFWGLEDKISHVIVTHGHVDHAGNGKYYQDMGAKIIVGEGDADYLCEAGGFSLFHETRFDEGAMHLFPAFTPDILIKEDCVMEINGIKFEFIMIPGHTVGSIAIRVNLDGKVIMFTGDSISPYGDQCKETNISWHGDPKWDPPTFVESMLKLQEYECDMVLGGHLAIVVRNGTKVLRKAAKTAFLTLR